MTTSPPGGKLRAFRGSRRSADVFAGLLVKDVEALLAPFVVVAVDGLMAVSLTTLSGLR